MIGLSAVGPVLASLLAVHGNPSPDRMGSPIVESISRVVAKQYQTIVIRGVDFGNSQPYDGDSSYLWMVDVQGNGTGWWRAGCPSQYGPCTTTLNVSSWQPDRIVITGFTGSGQYPVQGDLVSFFLGDPQTGRGPAAASAMVE
ncbi:MAG TPA: hypothetical protein VGX91_04505 [Candidatus Cybelea sp.]|jgi:hypothetical protein|nr:hypothetical protein [Candidatus Cybelea sp.]